MSMPDVLSFDQLNVLGTEKTRSMPYEEYFGDIPNLSDEQKEDRINTAEALEGGFLAALILAGMMIEGNMVDYDRLQAMMQEWYEEVLEEGDITVSDSFRNYHIPTAIAGILATMMANPDDAFNFSRDRAMLIAENEASDIWNDSDFLDAIESGKTTKTWLPIIDNRTRDTHRELDGVTVPIAEPFQVGEYLMMFPTDSSMGAGMEEIANCRCGIEYS